MPSSNMNMGDRRAPLNPAGQSSPANMVVSTSRNDTSFSSSTTPMARKANLNDRLNTDYVDLGGRDDSAWANLTKVITGFVGKFVTPKTLLVVLRVLKAITLSFLLLNVSANLMYLIFMEILAPRSIRRIVGGNRDTIIRLYGLGLAAVAFVVELDVPSVAGNVAVIQGFKSFIPRAFLLFFISAISSSHPLNEIHLEQNMMNTLYGTDANLDDDQYASVSSEIPESAVVFQMVTSFILGVCAFTYLVFGVLCFDRFTSRAFISTRNPLVTTAIPTPASAANPGGFHDTHV